jgi:hypothetical protein
MKTQKIILKDITNSALSNADGIQLEVVLNQAISDGYSVIISFQGISVMTTSFLNSSLGNLIDKYGIDILSNIRLVDYTSTIASFIKKYISDIKSLSTS